MELVPEPAATYQLNHKEAKMLNIGISRFLATARRLERLKNLAAAAAAAAAGGGAAVRVLDVRVDEEVARRERFPLAKARAAAAAEGAASGSRKAAPKRSTKDKQWMDFTLLPEIEGRRPLPWVMWKVERPGGAPADWVCDCDLSAAEAAAASAYLASPVFGAHRCPLPGDIHIITGGNDVELRQDGDWTDKDERYARTDEYLDIVKLEWMSEKPFDFKGRFYNVQQGFGGIKPVQKPYIPIYFGGSSEAAIRVAGKHADIYALWGETYDQVRDVIAQVRAAAAEFGRADQIRFSLSLRPILADTEDKAWARAERILERTIEVRQKSGLPISGHAPQNAGSQRLLDAAAKGARLDKRLWTGVAAVTGASGNSTALVGTPDQVADALLNYYDLGVSTFLIRGFDPFDDAVDYGANLLPAFKTKLAQRALVGAK